MDSWKITLADKIKNTKETGKKQVMIMTNSKDDGAEVLKILKNHINELHPTFKNITGDYNPKDFRVNSEKEWGNDQFLENLQKLLAEVEDYDNGVQTEKEKDSKKDGDKKDGGDDDNNDNNNGIIILAAAVLVGAIIFYVWKK